MRYLLLPYWIILLLSISHNTYATTWDEPWHEKVVQEAESFVLAKVKSYDEEKGLKLEIIKTLAGKALEGDVEVSEFYLLDLCSVSGGHGPEFHFAGVDSCYFFLKKKDGKYAIPTPTTGFAPVKTGKVYATYRHSYHQSLVPVDVYEKTMTAIYNNYHGKSYDASYIKDYLNRYLSMQPAGFEQKELETFFAQHVALESLYHLKLSGYYDRILPFLNDSTNSHNRISAARALHAYPSKETKETLIAVVADTTEDDFVQVICVWTLAKLKPAEYKQRLTEIRESASEEDTGFGGNIMDPRVCTNIPSAKTALTELIGTL